MQLRHLVLAAAILALAACSEPPPPADTGAASTVDIDALLERQTQDFLRTQPKLASFLTLPEETAGGPYAARHPDYSPAGFAALRDLQRASAAELLAIDPAELSEADQLDREIVSVIHRYYAGSDAVGYGYIDDYFGHVPYVVNQLAGPIIDVPNVMTAQQRIASVTDAEDYLARLEGFGELIGGVRDKFLADTQLGVRLPPAIREGALSYLDGFTAMEATAHPLYQYLDDRLAQLDAEGSTHEALLARGASAISDVVFPAYRELAATVREHSTEDPAGDGIWAQPDGEALYADLVRTMGDTDLSPAEIHEVGLAEVARIQAEMDAILIREGYVGGTVGERMTAIGQEPRSLFEESDAGREALLASLNEQMVEMQPLLADFFGTVPEQEVEVRRIPPHTEDGAPGGYYTSPALDGSRPGIYWINLRQVSSWPKHALPTLTYHEASPGHHFQIALNLAQDDLPFLRRNAPFNAYIEGWALYAERVAWEMGLYTDDPLGDLGRLQAELYRAVRLVVDTGLHHHRWTREEAIDYFADTTGRPRGRATTEIERYMAWPGQALGYKLGMIKMVALRAQAEESLGAAFDIREYHDVVLLEGAMPMAVLERRVRDWVAEQQRAGG